MKLNKIFITLIILIVSLGAVNAAAGLNVVLANQNPDPVSPGNFVYLNVKLSNIGDQIIDAKEIKFKPNQYFKIAPGETETKIIGLLSPFSSGSSDSIVIAKYKVLVDPKTPAGLNTISFDIITSSGTFKYDFDILVQDNNPVVTVKDIVVEQISPGENQELKITLDNANSINLRNVKIALDLASIDDKIITMNSGSNEKIVDTLRANSEETYTFDITVSPDAISKSYLLPIIVSFEDTLENAYTNTVYGSVKVYSQPDLSLELDSQDIYTVGRGEFSLAIANPGTSKIKGVQIKILPSDDYEIIEGANQYVGDLNPDDFQTLQGDIYIKNAEQANLQVLLTYSDSYDVKTQETIEVPLKIYNEEQLKQYGFTQTGGSGATTYIIIIIIVAVAFFFWRRHNKKKRLNHARSK